MTTMQCPCCGSYPVAHDRPRVDLDANSVVWRGVAVLSPLQAEICAVFARRFGERIPTDEVIQKVWGARQVLSGDALLKHSIWSMRRKLNAIGLDVECGKGNRHGRRMVSIATDRVAA